MNLQLVKDEPPNFVEALEHALEMARGGKMNCLTIVYTIDDKIYTEYVKGDGTTLTEMIGCVEIARTELVEAMRL